MKWSPNGRFASETALRRLHAWIQKRLKISFGALKMSRKNICRGICTRRPGVEIGSTVLVLSANPQLPYIIVPILWLGWAQMTKKVHPP